MSKEKERFAAIMINHWYVVSRALEIGRLRRHPRSKNYTELKDAPSMTDAQLKAAAKNFISYTAKNFYANLQHAISEDPYVKSDDAKVKVEFARATQRRGMPINITALNVDFNQLQSVIKALNFHEQHPKVKELLEHIPPLSLEGNSMNKFQITVPPAILNISSSLVGLEKNALRSFNNLKSFLNLYALILSSLSEKELKDVRNDKALITLVEPRFEDGQFIADGVALEETEEARNQRVLRQKLEERMALRTRKTTQIDLDPNLKSVTYMFDGQPHDPLTINLDVVTTW